MAGNVTYKPNPKGFGDVARSDRMKEIVAATAEKAMEIAKGIAADFTDTGDYLDSFKVEVVEVTLPREPQYGPRAAGRLVNTSKHAILVEVVDNHHVFQRTIDAMISGA